MKAFEYASPASASEAVQLLGTESAAALGGGTDLINRMKDYVSCPARVVDLGRVKDLAGIKEEGGGLVIGAGTRLAEIVASEAIARQYPAILQATLEVGTPQIRNMATVGGNLLQRPRDWYYRSGFGLLGGRPNGKSVTRELGGEPASYNLGAAPQGHLVRTGDNRYAAVFMTDQDALFVNPSSLAPPLIALGATATILGPKGERTVPVEKLYQVPKQERDIELTVGPGELLTKVTVPPCKGKNATYEVRQKQSHDWPLVLCSASVELDGEKVTKARIVLGGVAPVPLVCDPAAEAIQGKPLTRENTEAAGKAAIASAKPLSMNAYKVQLTRVAIDRVLQAIAGNRYWEA